jgi:fused signal recognition particle receptor
VAFSGRFDKFKAGLKKTREALSVGLARIIGAGQDRDRMLEEIEELLVGADVGVRTAAEIVDRTRSGGVPDGPDGLRQAIKREIVGILASAEKTASSASSAPGEPGACPRVVMVVGVNGTGKTTTIAKLAARYTREGKCVLLAAADTYRAAAIEQLEVWAGRIGSEVVKHKPGADAASVAFDACAAAKARGADLVIVDTAGRLQTKKNLMDEVAKR